MQDLRIIYYHHISSDQDHDLHAVPLNHFKKQLIYLRKRYEIISLSDAIQMNAEGHSLKGKLCITFDDGFSSFYQNALPVLKHHDLPATVFLISNCVNNQQIMWRTKLELISQQTPQSKIEKGLTLLEKAFDLQYDHSTLMKWSLNWPMSAKEIYTDFLWEEMGMIPVEDFLQKRPLYLTTQQIEEAMQSGIEFGSHTKSHPLCNKLSFEELIDETEGSLLLLSILLKKEIRLFSYPFGLRPDPKLENDLMIRHNISSLLGIYYKKYHTNDPFHWERDNMEIHLYKSLFRLSPVFDLVLTLRNGNQ